VFVFDSLGTFREVDCFLYWLKSIVYVKQSYYSDSRNGLFPSVISVVAFVTLFPLLVCMMCVWVPLAELKKGGKKICA